LPDGGVNILGQLIELARQFQVDGKLEEAGTVCTRIIAATGQPTSPLEMVARAEAFNFLAGRAVSANQIGTAIDFFHQATQLALTASDRAIYHMNLSRVLLQIGWKDRARQEADRALKIAPKDQRVAALRLRGLCAREEGDGEGALGYQREAMRLAPEDTASALEFTATLADTGRLDEAQAMYQKAADGEEYKAEGLHGVGLCLMRKMECAEAIDYFDRALELDPGMNMARWNRALSRLTIGDLTNGFRDHEYRFRLGANMPGVAAPAMRFARPMWDGLSAEDGGAKRIHLHSEMGHGDTLQFCRYALLLRDMGHDVRIETTDELVDLLAYSLPGVAVRKQADDWPGGWGLDEFDFHAPMMSMPYLMRTSLETVPWNGPYLSATPESKMEWAKRLRDVLRPRVGICWHGRSRDALWVRQLDGRRSMPFSMIEALMAQFPGMAFISLQNDGGERHPQLLRYDEYMKSFADTAGLIANLDLVLTVDTSALHLAAAMGKPTWMMDRRDHCWRWHEPFGDRSPWYDSLRIYRQPLQGDWRSVIEAVARDLEDLPC
jgi:Tfp pilus assembly protein PilF